MTSDHYATFTDEDAVALKENPAYQFVKAEYLNTLNTPLHGELQDKAEKYIRDCAIASVFRDIDHLSSVSIELGKSAEEDAALSLE